MSISTFKTTEFWIALLTILGAVALQLTDVLPASWAAIVITVSACAYAASRGVAKYGMELKRGWQTTEFWIGILGVGVMIIASINTDWSAKWAALLSAIVAAFYTLSRGVVKNAPETQWETDVTITE